MTQEAPSVKPNDESIEEVKSTVATIILYILGPIITICDQSVTFVQKNILCPLVDNNEKHILCWNKEVAFPILFFFASTVVSIIYTISTRIIDILKEANGGKKSTKKKKKKKKSKDEEEDDDECEYYDDEENDERQVKRHMLQRRKQKRQRHRGQVYEQLMYPSPMQYAQIYPTPVQYPQVYENTMIYPQMQQQPFGLTPMQVVPYQQPQMGVLQYQQPQMQILQYEQPEINGIEAHTEESYKQINIATKPEHTQLNDGIYHLGYNPM
ncbi:hypothetical protein AK88_03552 [Plasmodium fragile]|uniref:Uncharacterized protein n=1 Tax=Plasmodium fragile TaxID=5857 RepID=A0A0D9QIQ6_PLAFR|nr:uncharacterized protein AK88_03552 [Plasmodium fragile]KJP86843.1 hypothetical protein AK88_03552 [Plasmodium fragile]